MKPTIKQAFHPHFVSLQILLQHRHALIFQSLQHFAQHFHEGGVLLQRRVICDVLVGFVDLHECVQISIIKRQHKCIRLRISSQIILSYARSKTREDSAVIVDLRVTPSFSHIRFQAACGTRSFHQPHSDTEEYPFSFPS